MESEAVFVVDSSLTQELRLFDDVAGALHQSPENLESLVSKGNDGAFSLKAALSRQQSESSEDKNQPLAVRVWLGRPVSRRHASSRGHTVRRTQAAITRMIHSLHLAIRGA